MIKYIITDCDGTLTDCRYYVNSKGEMTKTFNVKDNAAVRMFKEKGIIMVMITSARVGQSLFINRLMAAYMEFDHFIPAKIGTKLQTLKENDIILEESIYVGDGQDDMECLKAVKKPYVPKSADKSVQRYGVVLKSSGGEGVLMEIYERNSRLI